jgi:hypothetical protein
MERPGGGGSQRGVALEDLFQIVIMVAIEAADALPDPLQSDPIAPEQTLEQRYGSHDRMA